MQRGSLLQQLVDQYPAYIACLTEIFYYDRIAFESVLKRDGVNLSSVERRFRSLNYKLVLSSHNGMPLKIWSFVSVDCDELK